MLKLFVLLVISVIDTNSLEFEMSRLGKTLDINVLVDHDDCKRLNNTEKPIKERVFPEMRRHDSKKVKPTASRTSENEEEEDSFASSYEYETTRRSKQKTTQFDKKTGNHDRKEKKFRSEEDKTTYKMSIEVKPEHNPSQREPPSTSEHYRLSDAYRPTESYTPPQRRPYEYENGRPHDIDYGTTAKPFLSNHEETAAVIGLAPKNIAISLPYDVAHKLLNRIMPNSDIARQLNNYDSYQEQVPRQAVIREETPRYVEPPPITYEAALKFEQVNGNSQARKDDYARPVPELSEKMYDTVYRDNRPQAPAPMGYVELLPKGENYVASGSRFRDRILEIRNELLRWNDVANKLFVCVLKSEVKLVFDRNSQIQDMITQEVRENYLESLEAMLVMTETEIKSQLEKLEETEWLRMLQAVIDDHYDSAMETALTSLLYPMHTTAEVTVRLYKPLLKNLIAQVVNHILTPPTHRLNFATLMQQYSQKLRRGSSRRW